MRRDVKVLMWAGVLTLSVGGCSGGTEGSVDAHVFVWDGACFTYELKPVPAEHWADYVSETDDGPWVDQPGEQGSLSGECVRLLFAEAEVTDPDWVPDDPACATSARMEAATCGWDP
jgi:hypothetical protein